MCGHIAAVRTDLSHRCVGDNDCVHIISIAIMICNMQDGATPLFVASQEGHTAVVEMLVLRGANVDQPMEV